MSRGFLPSALAIFACLCGNVFGEDESLTFLRAVPFEFIYPQTPAADLEPIDECAIVVARGEYEPATFVVRSAGRAYEDVTVRIGALQSQEGAVLPSESVDARIVKEWDQTLAGIVQSFPEILVTQDDLSNIHLAWREAEIDGQRALLAEAPAFPQQVRTSLEADRLKQFWITIHVPEEQPAGVYRGTVEVLSQGTTIGSLPLRVFVLPVTLRQPGTLTAIYLGVTLGPRGGYAKDDQRRYQSIIPEQEFRATLRFLKEHGIEGAMLYDQEYEDLEKAFAIAHEVGMRGPIVQWFLPEDLEKAALMYKQTPLKDYEGSYVPFYSEAEEAELERRVELARRYGYEPYFYGIDEIPGSLRPLQQEITRQTRAVGGKVVTAMKAANTAHRDLFDWSNMSHVFIPATLVEDRYDGEPEPRRTASAGGRPYRVETQYWGCQREAPLANRHLSGFHHYRTGLDGIFPWGARFVRAGEDIYHESHSARNSCFIYPAKDGVVPTLQSEGLREGIDDLRYIRTVEEVCGPSDRLTEILRPFSYTQVRSFTLKAEDFTHARLALVGLLAERLRSEMPAGMYQDLDTFLAQSRRITTRVHFPAEGWVTLRPAESFVPQYSFPVSDTLIASGETKPAGAAGVMELTRDRGAALVRFDLGVLPANVNIEKAELRLFHFNLKNTQPLRVGAYQLTSVWDEASATWEVRRAGVAWGTAGGDHEAEPLDTQVVDGTDANVAWDITSAVKAWHAQPELNHGVAIKGVSGEGVARFTTSETTDWRWRASFYVPALHIKYSEKE